MNGELEVFGETCLICVPLEIVVLHSLFKGFGLLKVQRVVGNRHQRQLLTAALLHS